MEWQTKYNSFNSWKGLTYYQNYKDIMAWMKGGDYLPPPVECNLDPVAECNLKCYFCITQRYLRKNRAEVGEMRELPDDYIHELIDFLADWGVRGLCISGGGEPTLHPKIEFILSHAVAKMDTALVTNATKVIFASQFCKWVALSVDAADQETYKRIKGVDLFKDVCWNIDQMMRIRQYYNSKTNYCFKFLILPHNVHQIVKACKLAKELGVQHFHARPVDFERSDIKGHKKLLFNVERIKEDFAKCHELEDKNFKVFTVTHKFDEHFHVAHDFDRCLATPLVIPILTDGNAYLCVDKKMEKKYKLGSCYPDPERILSWWGSDEHRELVKKVNVDSCSRCTWSQYNQQIENVVLKDNMDVSFP